MNPNHKTLTDLAATPIAGKIRPRPIVKKVVQYYGVPTQGKFVAANLYDISDVEAAFKKFDTETPPSTNQFYADNSEMTDLRKQKLQREVELLSKDIQRKDLQIEQLRNTLIDYNEVYEFLLVRTSVEAALLRRVLFTNLPVDVPGLTVAKAREKSEHYYNELMETFKQTITIWEKKYGVADTNKLKDTIEGIITAIETAPDRSRLGEQCKVLQGDC